MNTREANCQKQAERQMKFPPDRIAFCHTAANADQAAFRTWADNPHCSFAWLRRQIAENNYLDEFFPYGMIPSDMMKHELELLGWKKWKGIEIDAD